MSKLWKTKGNVRTGKLEGGQFTLQRTRGDKEMPKRQVQNARGYSRFLARWRVPHGAFGEPLTVHPENIV